MRVDTNVSEITLEEFQVMISGAERLEQISRERFSRELDYPLDWIHRNHPGRRRFRELGQHLCRGLEGDAISAWSRARKK